MLASALEEKRASIEEEIADAYGGFASDPGIVLPRVTWIVSTVSQRNGDLGARRAPRRCGKP